MARETICEACQREHHGKPPCLKTGKPCKEIEAGLRSENAASQSTQWRKVVLVGTTEELERLENYVGLEKLSHYFPKR